MATRVACVHAQHRLRCVMREFIRITKAMGDEARVRALMSLVDGELCVCQIITLLGLSPSTVSRHMSLLEQAGLVERRKEGRWHFYRLAGRDGSSQVRAALRFARGTLVDHPTVVADRRALERIRTSDPSLSARCYVRAST